jgi:hypothetical protein
LTADKGQRRPSSTEPATTSICPDGLTAASGRCGRCGAARRPGLVVCLDPAARPLAAVAGAREQARVDPFARPRETRAGAKSFAGDNPWSGSCPSR